MVTLRELYVKRACVHARAWHAVSQEMTWVFRHIDAGLALGEREGARRRGER